jgi:outer membrane protein W
MVKKSLIVASLLFATTSAMAQNKYFMGVGIGSGSWTPEVKVVRVSNGASATVSESDSSRVLSILGGTIIDNKHKLSIGYSTYNTDADVDMTSVDLGYAYFIDQDSLKITNKKWKPFVGAGYSMSTYTEKLSSSYDKSEFKLTTKALMIGIGTDYEIDKKQFLTIGYDFSLSTSGSESATLTTGGNDYNVNMEVDKISRFLVSYNYKF